MHSSSSISIVAQRVVVSAGLIACIALSGCASTRPVAYRDLSSSSQLKPVKDGPDLYEYKNPHDHLATYTALMVDPVTIYRGPDSQFGSVKEPARNTIAQYMERQFAEALGKQFKITDSPSPGRLRLHLTLTGIETSTPVVSTLSHIAPVGLLVNSGLEASGNKGTFFGSVSYAVELYDAVTGELLYASISKETAHALDVTASFGSLDAAKAGVRRGAGHLRNDLAASFQDLRRAAR
jgi:Protein of unknown function (DUF3313)